MFTEKDLSQICEHGSTLEAVQAQVENFRRGFPFLHIDRAAVGGDGIRLLDESTRQGYAEAFRQQRAGLDVVKFVPASGAATRMFKDLFAYLDGESQNKAAQEVIDRIGQFAFAEALASLVGDEKDPEAVISGILSSEGLGYGTAPKALILFHRYAEGSRTALEEHLCEGALYAAGRGGEVSIHFTVSPEHRPAFEKRVREVLPLYEKKYGVRYRIAYSQQQPSTDTIAVSPDNEPFREEDGRLLFRPAGHGALLENLGSIDADVIFVKNIDNVTTDARKGDTVLYKEALAGLLLTLRAGCFERLKALDRGADEATLGEMVRFVETDLGQPLPQGFAALDAGAKSRWLRERLDRPIRVCGMVKNEGEPGGGPFWVKGPDGMLSLQIAESSQIASAQADLMARATHFNPVDLVCSTRNYRGERFDLSRFRDPSTGFISEKSKNGRLLRAQELPGLWNGAMAGWNTLFVEVPPTVFTPVKTINDLLRPQHQN